MSKFFVLGTKFAQANDNVVGAAQCVAHGTKGAVRAFIDGYKAQRLANKLGGPVLRPDFIEIKA